MELRNGEKEGAAYLASVKWDRTKAYSAGLAGIYLNRVGREGAGCVTERDADGIARQITETLKDVKDPATGMAPVLAVYRGRDIYTGAAAAEAPDLVLGLADGYRFSGETALGACPAELFADNTEPWTGTHLLDPRLVPGILLANRPITAPQVDGRDLAPTVLAALGVPRPAHYEGKPLVTEQKVS
jgi:predicted AlkP superfamily phosphohydrolase/phosphomutase